MQERDYGQPITVSVMWAVTPAGPGTPVVAFTAGDAVLASQKIAASMRSGTPGLPQRWIVGLTKHSRR